MSEAAPFSYVEWTYPQEGAIVMVVSMGHTGEGDPSLVCEGIHE